MKDFEGKDGEKIALIRDLREQKVSVKELGMKMLVKRLTENGAKLKNVEIVGVDVHIGSQITQLAPF